MMTLEEFKKLIEQQECPESLPRLLQAMWHVKKGNWDTAHELVQEASDADSAWIHAYLHREEGDLINARYWYNRGKQPESNLTLEQEWEQMASVLLMKAGKT
jgi:hypothetical protein